MIIGTDINALIKRRMDNLGIKDYSISVESTPSLGAFNFGSIADEARPSPSFTIEAHNEYLFLVYPHATIGNRRLMILSSTEQWENTFKSPATISTEGLVTLVEFSGQVEIFISSVYSIGLEFIRVTPE